MLAVPFIETRPPPTPFVVIDRRRLWVNIHGVDADDFLPRRSESDILGLLARQDLDPFSVAELEARIALLHAEIDRTQQKLSSAVNHKAIADSLFKT